MVTRKLRSLGVSIGVLLLCVVSSTGAVGYQIVDLTPSPGTYQWEARSINNSGVVVGNGAYAFKWTSTSGLTRLQVSDGWHYGTAYSINNNGQIAGIASDPSWYAHAVTWDSSGSMAPYNPAGTWAYGSNDSGQVVGGGSEGPVLWDTGGNMTRMSDITNGLAYDINNNGIAVGILGFKAEYPRAFTWSAGSGVQMLPTLGGLHSTARAINDSGEIIGSAYDASGGNHFVLWNSSLGITDLSFAPYAINNLGQIVGEASGFRAVLRDLNGSVTYLPSLPDATNACAYGINDYGWIVRYSGGHAVLWQPVPEPSSFLALGAGLLPLALALRRRCRRNEQQRDQ